jgi:hypothetical protein
MKHVAIILLALVILVAGCAGTSKMTPGQSKVVETSGDKPGWVKSDKDYWVADKNMNYRSMINSQVDIAQGRRNVKAEVVKQVAEMVKSRVRTDYYNSVKGDNTEEGTLGRDVADLVAWTTDNLEISGITPNSTYWEKRETYDGGAMHYAYDIYGLYTLPEAKYYEAVRKASMSMADKAKAANDKAAEERAKKFEKKLYEDEGTGQ